MPLRNTPPHRASQYVLAGGSLLMALILGIAAFSVWTVRQLEIAQWKEQIDNLTLAISVSATQSLAPAFRALDFTVQHVRRTAVGQDHEEEVLRSRALAEALHFRMDGLPQIVDVMIPDVVVRKLVVPKAFSRAGVECQQAVGIQVVAFA